MNPVPVHWDAVYYLLRSFLGDALLLGALAVSLLQLRRLRAERNALLAEKDVIYGFVHDVGEVFVESDRVDVEPLLHRVLFYAQRTTRAVAGAVYLFEPDGERLRARALTGLFPPLAPLGERELDGAVSKAHHLEQIVRRRLFHKGEGIVGRVADLGTPLLIADAELDERLPRHREEFLRWQTLMLVPMRFHQDVLGVLAVANRTDGARFRQNDLNLLQALADQAAVSVHYAGLRETLDEKKRLDHDMDMARQIQEGLLPKELPRLPGLELAAFNEPALQIGGDFYDVVPVDADHLGVAIADVSGKGISGAIMMSVCRSVLRAQAPGTRSPAAVLRALNRVLQPDMTEDMFISMLYLVLNTRTHEMRLARAGHEQPLLGPGADGAAPRLLASAGPALGLDRSGAFDAQLEELQVTLQPGDLLALYTDGITEAQNPEGEEWGVRRLREAVQQAGDDGAGAVLHRVREQLTRFVGHHPQYDDMTLVVLRLTP